MRGGPFLRAALVAGVPALRLWRPDLELSVLSPGPRRVIAVDAPLALYRRYRPDTFTQVIGQDHVTGPLRAALRNNRVSHAYLFSGPRGCGKTTSARILARALNCAEGPTEEPCGRCDSCRELATGGPGSVDVIEIDAASHGGVDDARDLREQATFRPMRDRYKVYIIDEAHMVSSQGFNALLKIVEEPPEHVRFIFATTEPEKVIGTVRSRTHHYPFRLIPPRVLSAYLSELCAKEGVAIEPAALPLVVRAGAGSARDTLSVLDQLIGGAVGGTVTYELAAGLLGFTPDTLLDEVVDAFAAQDGAAVFGVVDKVVETGQDPRRFTEDLLRRLRDLVIVAAVPDAPATGLIDVPEDQAERLVAQAARFGRHDLSRAADLVAAGLSDLRGTTAPRLILELLCARVLLPGADDTSAGLAARLDRVEKRMAMAPASSQVVQDPAPHRPARPETALPAAGAATQPTGQLVAQSATQSATRPATQPDPGSDSGDREAAAGGPVEPAAPVPGLSLVDVRRLWPDIVDAVKDRRRLTWIQLSQHAQAVGLDGRTLTVGFNNAGARESFVNGRSDLILQQVIIDLVGQDWKVEAIVDPSAQPGQAPPPAAPAGSPQPPPAQPPPAQPPAAQPPAAQPPPAQPDPAPHPRHTTAHVPDSSPAEPPPWAVGVGGSDNDQVSRSSGARGAIRPTRPTGAERGRSSASSASAADSGPSDDDADRDDPELEALDGAQLLTQRLGAQVIEEIPHG